MHSAKSIFDSINQFVRRQSRLTIGATAAGALAVAGASVGVASAATTSAPPAHLSALSHTSTVRAAELGVAPGFAPLSGPSPLQPTQQGHQSPASLAVHASVASQRISNTHSSHHAASQHATQRSSHNNSAKHAPAPHKAAHPHKAPVHKFHYPKPTKPFLIYDSVTPTMIPLHHMIATYATGGYAVPASVVSNRRVMWIDTRGTDPGASALDVEPGDATPALAALWAQQKLKAEPHSIAHIYTMISEWPAVQAAVAHLPGWMHSHIRWWIADPTGVPHVVPGSQATQWYWGKNYDITTALPNF
jgi:hypothetical protein